MVVAYEALKEKVKEKAIFIENVEEVINVDVQRSFNHYKQIEPQVKNLLILELTRHPENLRFL